MTTTPLSARGWNQLVAAVRRAESDLASVNWSENPTAHDSAKQRRAEAYAALREAFQSAEWGRNGSVFITDRANAIASPSRTRTLWIQGRRVASCGHGWVAIVDPAKAEAERAEDKRLGRAREAAYKAERQQLIDRLVVMGHNEPESFAEWTHTDGENGGTFHREGSRIWVAAKSALRAAEPLRSFVASIYDEADEYDDLDDRAVRTRARSRRK